MDFRDYLDLEAALTLRLMKTWGQYAAPHYAKIAKAVKEKDWDTAYEVAQSLDLTDAVKVQAPYINAVLKTTALFGAKVAGNGKSLMLGTFEFSGLMKHVVDIFLATVEWNVTRLVRDAATQSIARAQQANEQVVKADDPRFVKPFVSFRQEGDRALQLVSSLHTSRLSTWGFTAEAEFLGYTEYELSAVLDGRTSEFCRLINGKKFKVADARQSIVTILSVQNPDDVKTLQPWPKQNKAAIEAFSTQTPEQLTAQGLHIPPFHPYCRTMLVPVGKAPKLAKPVVQKPKDVIPEILVGPDDFKALGLSVPQDKVDHWNTYVKLSPVEVLSKLSGYSPKDIVAGELGKRFKTISFDANGDIRLRFLADVGTRSSGMMTFNPYSGVLYQNRMDFLAAEKVDALRFFRQLELNKMLVAQSLGATEMVVAVGFGQAVTYGKLGYLPTPEAWAMVRQELLDEVAGTLAKDFAKLPKKEQSLIMLCLSSKDERAFRALADMGTKFIRKLFSGVAFSGHLDIADPEVVAKHAGAL